MRLALAHVDLIVEAVEALRRHGEGELATALDNEIVGEFWDSMEPTDSEILRTSRVSHDLGGYDLGDPKRITLERENRL